jgi:hypothetical protein
MKILSLLIALSSLSLPVFSQARPQTLSEGRAFNLRRQIAQGRYNQDMQLVRQKNQIATSNDIVSSLRSGDLLLVRTTSLTGSIAARASEVPGQFSHLILIAEDSFSHELKAIQSDQGEGVHIDKVDMETLKPYVRMGLFRFENPKLAKLAAEKLLQVIETRMLSGPIRYDNKMDFHDSSSIYCTEIASWAFSLVGVNVPQRLSHIHFLTPELRDELGISTNEIFTPQDIEIDSRFKLVKEWRDLNHLQETYLADAIFEKYYSWIADGIVQLKPGVLNRATVSLLASLFSSKIAQHLGEDPADGKRVTQLMKYSLSMYGAITTYEAAIKKELRFVDTTYYKVSDYEVLLEQLRRENRLDGQRDPTEDVYYGR